MVPASWHWERKRGEEFGWLIVRQIQAEWLIQVDWSSSWLAVEWHRWQGARLIDASIIVSCCWDLIQSDLWRGFFWVELAVPLNPKLKFRRIELICHDWRWEPSPTVGVGLADCTHVNLHWSWPRCCRR